VLGLNAYHGDASACLLKSGALIAAVEEERFNRIKHWAGFPLEAIKYCLAEGRISLSDIDVVAVNSNNGANFVRRFGYLVTHRPTLTLIREKIRNRIRRKSIDTQLEEHFPGQEFKGCMVAVEHHLAHLSSAYHTSLFEEAVAVSVDGFGDFSSAAWGFGCGNELEVDRHVHFPHSLGVFYQAMTQYLGFPNYGDEYKVMGLAAYGTPKYKKAIDEILKQNMDGTYRLELRYFRHNRHEIGFEWTGGEPKVGRLFDSEAMEELLGPLRSSGEPLTQRHKDIASSVQTAYEGAFFRLLNITHEKYRTKQLALAGGCAMNSVANGKITQSTPFRQVYVQPAAGDAGGAIGAALTAWYQSNPSSASTRVPHAYWGPGFDEKYVEELVRSKRDDLGAARCFIDEVSEEHVLCDRIASEISAGKVTGWFQGRMEWGPRALGNRSILCDPRRADMKDILNMKIKRRESFRPFASSIIREEVGDWFTIDDDVPFMTKVFPIRPEKISLIPAVTHVDGTGRLQTVTEEENPRFYGLITSFLRKTGVPILLNTSFNENEPIVCRPEEALDCFLRTDMDLLVMKNHVISRQR
jgi:carbamoyltransferase